jgi:hypothetical protein
MDLCEHKTGRVPRRQAERSLNVESLGGGEECRQVSIYLGVRSHQE